MTFTHGQKAKLGTIIKGNVLKLSSDRQVGAIRAWIDHNKRSGALDVFVAKDVAQLREWITAIGDYCGCYTGHPAFKQALAQVIVNRDEGMFAEVIGRHGRVPAQVVEAICERYKMKRPVVLEACNTMAAVQGMNGVMAITRRTDRYDGPHLVTVHAGGGWDPTSFTHELKLLPMGEERVYASTAIAGVPVFDKVGKHL